MRISRRYFCMLLALAGFTLLPLMGTARAQDAEPDAKTKAEIEKLQGVWYPRSLVIDGTDAPPDVTNSITLEFKGREVIQKSGGDSHPAKFSLDTSTSPMRLSITPKDGDQAGKTIVGLYKIEGDTLTICLRQDDKTPKDFDAAKGSGNMLAVLKRTRPATKSADDSEAGKADKAVWEAVVKQDNAALERLLAPGFVSVTPGGVAYDRASFLKNLTAQLKLAKADRENTTVREFGGGSAAVVTGIVRYGDNTDTAHTVTRLYVKGSDGWQIVAAQATKQNAQPADAASAPDSPKLKDTGPSADVEAVKAVLKTENAALLKQDVDALNRIYTDDFILIAPSGETVSKTAWQALLKGIKLDQMDVSEQAVAVYGNVAASVSKVETHVAGTSDYHAIRVLEILVKEPDGWRVVSYQTTYAD